MGGPTKPSSTIWTNTGQSRSGHDGKAQVELTLGFQVDKTQGVPGKAAPIPSQDSFTVWLYPKRRDQTHTQNGLTGENHKLY